ncbi:MAG TPA: PilZ domain-containing protein [Candidatus Acidoferrales bacterium]
MDYSRKRRSNRILLEIPIYIRVQKGGALEEEEAQTRVISRYGAMVVSRQDLMIGDEFQLAMVASGQVARAHVVWRKKSWPSRAWQMGVEIMGQDNFWGLHWSPPPGQGVPGSA